MVVTVCQLAMKLKAILATRHTCFRRRKAGGRAEANQLFSGRWAPQRYFSKTPYGLMVRGPSEYYSNSI